MTDRLLPVEARLFSAEAIDTEELVHELYARRAQSMFGFARRLGLGDEDASDAVQETMARLCRELDAEVGIDDPDAWAFRVLYRIAIDHHRFRRRLGEALGRLMPWTDSPEAADPAERADTDAVWHAVDRLPERQRAVLYLRYRADMAYDGIGRVLSITPSAARGHASTGLATLRRQLLEDNDDGR